MSESTPETPAAAPAESAAEIPATPPPAPQEWAWIKHEGLKLTSLVHESAVATWVRQGWERWTAEENGTEESEPQTSAENVGAPPAEPEE